MLARPGGDTQAGAWQQYDNNNESRSRKGVGGLYLQKLEIFTETTKMNVNQYSNPNDAVLCGCLQQLY